MFQNQCVVCKMFIESFSNIFLSFFILWELKKYIATDKNIRDRMYIDAMQSVLSNTTKVMIDIDSGNNLMLLPLDKMMEQGNSLNSNQLRILRGETDE